MQGHSPNPLRARFGIVNQLQFYDTDDLAHIITRSANLLNVPIEEAGAYEIARRSRGTPRVANRLLRRVRDFAQVRHNGVITAEVADAALRMLEVDAMGLDFVDQRFLLTIMDKFAGGPVGIDNLASAVGEDRETLEDVVEPYLIQQGLVQRTPRGRIVTQTAYRHFGVWLQRRRLRWPTSLPSNRISANTSGQSPLCGRTHSPIVRLPHAWQSRVF